MTRPRTGNEKQTLSAFLDQQLDVLLWKLDGLASSARAKNPIGALKIGSRAPVSRTTRLPSNECITGQHARNELRRAT